MVYQLFKTISQFLESLLRGRDTKCWETVCDMTVYAKNKIDLYFFEC